MARFMSRSTVVDMLVEYFPSWLSSRQETIKLDAWLTGRQQTLDEDPDDPMYGLPFAPRDENTNAEYDNLRTLSPNAFAGLIVATLSQTAYVEGISRSGSAEAIGSWDTFRRNSWDAKQSQIHRAAIGHGAAFGLVLPGVDPLTGDKAPRMIGKSAKKLAAFYDADDDEWPRFAIEAEPLTEDTTYARGVQTGWTVRVYDDHVTHFLSCKGNGTDVDAWTYISYEEHGTPVPPVARCVNRIDLDGVTTSEIEPVLPLLRRIDQTTFDRLVVQRFGAWQVRYIAGMAKPTSANEAAIEKMRLRVEDILISTNENTKFGTLQGSPLEPYTNVTDSDLRVLSAITQTPPHHLLGLSSNLQAEALAAAEAALQRKSFDFRTNAGEFHERMARLVALQEGDMETARAWDLRVRWRDTESRSMTQAADALGKLAVQLKVPVEMLWEKIPGWTDTDVARAKNLVEDGSFQRLIQELMDGADTADQNIDQAAGSGGDEG